MMHPAKMIEPGTLLWIPDYPFNCWIAVVVVKESLVRGIGGTMEEVEVESKKDGTFFFDPMQVVTTREV